MKTFILSITLIATFFSFGSISKVSAAGTAYYVDNTGGNDSNNGTSSASAWQTLTKVNSVTFNPGDQILFKAGGQWTGGIVATSSGTSGNPILYGSYGTGNQPQIITTSTVQYGVKVWNKQYIEINDLFITSNLSSPDTKHRAGVLIASGGNTGTLNHIYVLNCEISQIWSTTDAQGHWNKDTARIFGGIAVTAWGSTTPYNDIKLDGNYIHDVNYAGIYMDNADITNESSIIWEPNGSTRMTNVVFQNNTVQNSKGDAIVFCATQSALIQNNVAINAPSSNDSYFAGIWAGFADNAVIQFNEVFGITGGSGDGVAFDDDTHHILNTVQYNYSHNNKNGASMSMGTDPIGIFRYNISKDETPGAGGGGHAFPINYNNVYYVSAGLSIGKGITGLPNTATNNIFANYGNTQWDFSASTSFKNNNFVGNVIPGGSGQVNADPKFVNPGSVGTGIITTVGFKLQSSSPLINAGVSVSNNGGRDFWGNTLVNRSLVGTLYEAESATTNATIMSRSTASGNPTIGGHQYQNSGKVVGAMDNIGKYVTVTVNSPFAGSNTIEIWYANGTGNTATKALYINGIKLQDVTYPATGNWMTFSKVTVTATLNAGDNTIQIKTDNGNVWTIDIDCLITRNAGVTNPGFETGGLSGWTEWHSGTVAYGVDGNGPHSGSYKAYFWAPSAYQESIHQLATGLANGSYTVKAWIKASGTTANTARMELNKYGGGQVNTNFAFNNTWTQYTSTVNVANGQLDIGFYCDSPGNSSVEIDDVQLIGVANPGFETGNLSGWTESHSGNVAYGVDGNGPHSGSYKAYFWTSGAYQESIHQLAAGLANGSYTVKAWIKAHDTPATICRMEVSNYGGSEVDTNCAFNNTWTQYTSTVNVTGGQLDIGFYCNSPGNSSMEIDDVQLIAN